MPQTALTEVVVPNPKPLANKTRVKETAEFEDYNVTSQVYDNTRQPVGIGLILGQYALTPTPLNEQRVLDGGCGTGNYVGPLCAFVGKYHGLEYNEGMFTKCQTKFASNPNFQITHGSLLEIPYESNFFDGIHINQVIHHLDEEGGNGGEWPNITLALKECFRVLKPGGVIILNVSTREQCLDGFWWAGLIPEAAMRVAMKTPPIESLVQILTDVGFAKINRAVLVDEFLQGDQYLDSEGPLKEFWREGDSTWALATPEELEAAKSRVKALLEEDAMAQYISSREALREKVGQSTSIWARVPHQS